MFSSAHFLIFFIFKVQTKTVAQCVEFYYTYKRQVKVGRNGIVTFGPPDSPGEKQLEVVVDVKVEWVALPRHPDMDIRVMGSSALVDLGNGAFINALLKYLSALKIWLETTFKVLLFVPFPCKIRRDSAFHVFNLLVLVLQASQHC